MSATGTAQSQTKPEFTDPIQLLQAVAKNYGAAADTFRVESIQDSVNSGEYRNEWTRTYRSVIKGPGKQYRIEVRTSMGAYLQVSDGVHERVYQVETDRYAERPVPANWPGFPKMMDMGLNELKQAWEARTWLEQEALGYKQATMLPEETIVVEGRRYACYVVRAQAQDSVSYRKNQGLGEETFWVDKEALVFRKKRRIADSFIQISQDVQLPWHSETTELYPVVELNPQTTPEMFRFSPPATAKLVDSLEPKWGGPPPSEHPTAKLVGEPAPEVTLTAADGKKIALSAYRGKPLLLDFWATWCGPCLLSMPGLTRIYTETKAKGLAVVSVDWNEGAEDGPLYFDRHHYTWTNFHDEDKAVRKAFKAEGIPLTVLIDAQGKIVYYDFAKDEAALRKAIAGLGPEYATVAAQ